MPAAGILPMLFVLTLSVAGCSGSDSKEGAGVTSSPPVEPPAVVQISEQTREFNNCSNGGDLSPYGEPPKPGRCIALTPTTLTHPKYGQVDFTIGLITKGEETSLAYWLLNSDGHVLQVKTVVLNGPAYELTAPKLDGSGNIIFSYNPGRSDGCVALQPKGDWFEGFGTDPMKAPDPEVLYSTRFYGCKWVDENQDGTLEILYRPSGRGADDKTLPSMFAWNGHGYAFIGSRPLTDE